MIIKSKKAQTGDMMMIFAFMFLLLIIGTGIYFGTSLFFSSNYDFRKTDTEILNRKLTSCFKENNINLENPEALKEEISTLCKINPQVIENYLLIIIFKDSSPGPFLKIGKGDETSCALEEKNINFPKCMTSEIIKNYNKQPITLKVIVGSNQNSREKLA